MTVDSLEAGAALVPLSANGVALGPGAVSDATGSSVRLEVPAGTALVLAALTSTPAAYDPATRPFAAATLGATITVELAAETESDAGVGNRRPPMGCGCGSTTADGISVLAALFLAATRRRREFDRASPRAPPLHAQRHKR